MSYRPQFAYATPPGCRDEDFVYFFDASNVPMLTNGISPGVEIDYIPLPLDQDAPFYWRGWKVDLLTVFGPHGCPAVYTVTHALPDFRIKLRDCYDNDLSSAMVNGSQSGYPQNPVVFLNQALTGPPVALEPERICPRGGVVQAFIRGGASLSAAAHHLNFVRISLFGVKRYKECKG